MDAKIGAYGALPSDHSGSKESIALRGLGQMRLLWPSRRSEVESISAQQQREWQHERSSRERRYLLVLDTAPRKNVSRNAA